MIQGRIRYYALRAYRSIWFRPALYAVYALLAIGMTPLVEPLIPEAMVYKLDRATVDRVLDILATSMLAVAIFSMSTMVGQLNAAAQSATPRTRPLLSQDRTAQTAISTFIGTFLFAVLGVIGIELGLYDDTGLFVLFALALILIALVIVNLILWIRRLSEMGGVGEAIERVEQAAALAFDADASEPFLGGAAMEDVPERGHAVHAATTGYVQSIDGALLGEVSEGLGATLHVLVRPGDYVDAARPAAVLESAPDDDAVGRIREAIVVGKDRDFAGDPRYGMIVLSEIASRALSPGINDPGTAIDVIGTSQRVLADWRRKAAEAEPEVRWPLLRLPPLDPAEVLSQAFRGIARDGAGQVEVGIRLQHALETLSLVDPGAFEEPARRIAGSHLDRARRAMDAEDDISRLEDAYDWSRSRRWTDAERRVD